MSDFKIYVKVNAVEVSLNFEDDEVDGKHMFAALVIASSNVSCID